MARARIASVDGLDAVMERLDAISEAATDGSVGEAMKRHADMEARRATDEFASAEYPGSESHGVVEATGSGNVVDVTASGHKVLFIEYGAGINLEHSAVGSARGYLPGGYSKNLEKLVEHSGWWTYPAQFGIGTGAHGTRMLKDHKRIITQGNPPAHVMYETGKRLRQDVPEVVRKAMRDAIDGK